MIISNAVKVQDPILRAFVDAMIAIIRLPNGNTPDPAPYAWKGSAADQVYASDTSEFRITFHVKPGGLSASCVVEPISSMAKSIQGPVDISLLAAVLDGLL
jgi:hypothetical protein